MSKPLTNDKIDIDDNIFGSDDSITALPSESQSSSHVNLVNLFLYTRRNSEKCNQQDEYNIINRKTKTAASFTRDRYTNRINYWLNKLS